MVSSHHMGGRFFEDFGKGVMDSEIQLGFIWLSKDEPPKWIEEFEVQNLSNRFLESRILILQWVGGLYATYKFKLNLIQTHLFRPSILGILVGKIM